MITGRQIRAARALLDISQEELARLAGLTKQGISKIEDGSVHPRETTLVDIMRVFTDRNVEFIDNEGIRRRPEEIRIMQGVADFTEFHELIYQHAQKHDDEICISGSDSGLYEKYRPNPEMHRERMAELAKKRGKKFFRILLKEGDTRLAGSEYATFRWQPPELFSPTTLYTFGDYLALISFYHAPAPHIILIHSKAYADAYKLAFEATWRNASEVAR